MPTAMPLTSFISQPAKVEYEDDVKVVQLGHGYEEVTSGSINPTRQVRTVTWANLTDSEKDTVVAALTAAGVTTAASTYLTWQPYGESSSLKWRVLPNTRSMTYNEGHWTIEVKLRQFF
jgi:phage-related protein